MLPAFEELKAYFASAFQRGGPVSSSSSLSLLEEQKSFIRSPPMKWAELIAPKALAGPALPPQRFEQAFDGLVDFIKVFYGIGEKSAECESELTRFLGAHALWDKSKIERYCDKPRMEYWATSGSSSFPLLSRIAQRLYTIPTSSAASERVWKVFSSIHTKKRNRLINKRVEALAFVKANAAVLKGFHDGDDDTDEEIEASDNE